MASLSKPQFALLHALASGEKIAYSRDGDCGWLMPGHTRLETFGVSDAELQQLRELRMIGAERQSPDDDDWYRDVITDAGRRALEEG